MNALERSFKMSDSEQSYESDQDDREEPLEERHTEENTYMNKEAFLFPISPVATDTCLYGYAIARVKGAENENQLPWHPIMLPILAFLQEKYERPNLVTELSLAMLELLLNVPVQIKIRYGNDGDELRLGDPNVLNFNAQPFDKSLIIMKDLLKLGFVKREQLRTGVIEKIESLPY